MKSGAMHTSHAEESVSDADSMLHQIESCMPPFILPRSRSAPLCVGASNLTPDLSSSDPNGPNPSAPAAPQTSLADPTKMEEDSKSNVVSRRQSLSSSVCSTLSSSGYSDKQRGRKRMRLQMEKVKSTFAGGQPCFERWPSHPGQLFQVGDGALPPAGPPRMRDAGPQMQDAEPQIETGRFTTPPSMSLPSLPPSIGPNLPPFRVRRPEPAIPFQIPVPFSVKAPVPGGVKAPVPGGVKAPVPGGVKAPVKAYMSSSTPTTFSVLPYSVTPSSAASAPCSAFQPKIAPIKWSRSQPDPKVRAQSDPFVPYEPNNQHPYASTMQNALTTPHGLPLCAPPNGWTARARAATLASMNGSRDPRQWKLHGALSTVEQIAPNRANVMETLNRTNKTIDLDQLFQSKKTLKGIRRTSSNKWVARIEHNGQQKHLGTYSTAAEAAMVYDRALYQVLSLTHPEKIVLKRFNFPERIAESTGSRHGYFR